MPVKMTDQAKLDAAATRLQLQENKAADKIKVAAVNAQVKATDRQRRGLAS